MATNHPTPSEKLLHAPSNSSTAFANRDLNCTQPTEDSTVINSCQPKLLPNLLKLSLHFSKSLPIRLKTRPIEPGSERKQRNRDSGAEKHSEAHQKNAKK
jgi:hypothetical protein